MDTADTMRQRERFLAEIEGRTLVDAFADTVARHADEPAWSDRIGVDQGWRTRTWQEMSDAAMDVAAGWIRVGVEAGDTVAIMAPNRIEHILADIGAMHAGATPMSVYATLAPAQVLQLVQNAQPTAVVLEGSEQLERFSRALAEADSIRTVVVLDEDALPADDRSVSWDAFVADGAAAHGSDPSVVADRADAVAPDDPVTILFTSGTTGDPKGVVLTHHNVLFEAISSTTTGDITEPGIQVSYLPYAHIAERTLSLYIPEYMGGHTHLIGDPADLPAALAEVRPTRFFGVPRVWEKIRAGVSARLQAEPDEQRRAAVQQAMEVGQRWVESQQYGATTSDELDARFAVVDEQVLGPIRALLGLDRVEWAASAAAPMPDDVAEFFAGLGIAIYDVYGMTETCASVTACGPAQFRLGTVGRALQGIEVTLADDGEILARGPVVTPGYHGNEAATDQLIDDDGWVHTGDIGEMDADGFLKVVDRKKEMIVTSTGKNIAPSAIENALKESPLVGHALAYGDGRSYVVALLTLDGEVAPIVAQKLGIEATSVEELAAHPQVQGIVAKAVADANEGLSRPEQVKAWHLLANEWTAESEELTPTLKLRRRVVHDKYDQVIGDLYDRADAEYAAGG